MRIIVASIVTSASPLTRPLLTYAVVLPVLSLVLGIASSASQAAEDDSVVVYIGSYSQPEQVGIHIFELDRREGALRGVGGLAGVKNPSFQALHPAGHTLYSVSESGDFDDQGSGSVTALAVEEGGRSLRLLNAQPSRGAGPCHVSVDHAGRHVVAANYGGGSIVVLPVAEDGRLLAPSAFVQHTGSSVHPRQRGPHAHCVRVDPDDRFVLTADLGLDQVLIYQFDNQRGSLAPNEAMPAARLTPGAGPRHLAFHPSGQSVYVINELSSTIAVFRYDTTTGTLDCLQETSTLPREFDGENTTAEVKVSPDGRFLYGSNRGHNSIAVFAIDPRTGLLTFVSRHASGGEIPRNFAIDPSGRFLLAANQRTNRVVVFRIDSQTGQLVQTPFAADVDQPVCVTFLAR